MPKNGSMEASRVSSGIKDIKKKNAMLDACVLTSLLIIPFISSDIFFLINYNVVYRGEKSNDYLSETLFSWAGTDAPGAHYAILHAGISRPSHAPAPACSSRMSLREFMELVCERTIFVFPHILFIVHCTIL
jgi:hypothetical protein